MLDNDEDQVDNEEIIIDTEEQVEADEIETDPISSDETESEEGPATIQESDDEDDRVVTIGDPEPESEVDEENKQETPGWIKKVRKSNRRLESENKRLQKELEKLNKPKEVLIELGNKPTLASVNYDEDKYDSELTNYYERKRKVDKQNAKRQELIKAQTEKRQSRQSRYVNLRKEYKFKAFEDAESLVENTFDLTQQEIIVQGAEDSALLVYALGKNPKKLEELASIQDPVEFAFKVAKLESKLKVTNRKKPSPEKRVKSGNAGGLSGNSDKVLERLREKAQKTGDYTEIRKYKKSLRDKG